MKTIIFGLSILMVSLAVQGQSLRQGENLMFNGSFDHPDDPLEGWTYNYGFLYNREKTQFDSRFYELNHERVSVLEREGGRQNVLQLQANAKDGSGTKVDGPPIAIDSNARYRLSMWGKTTGPGARIIVECYQWRPGIRPHDGIPKLTELRRTFKSKPIYFPGTTDGAHSGPTRQWTRGVREFPDVEMSRPARIAWQRAEFAVLHVVAILGDNRGALYIDDVVLEKIE